MASWSVARHPGLWGLGAVALGTAAAFGVMQRRHVHQIRRDPEYARLENPPRGRVLSVRSADGTELHAEVFGEEGAPTVVLAHGWTEALQYWTYVIDDLQAAGCRAIAFDLRGHGKSQDAASGEYSLERFGEDIEAVLQASLAPDERAIVVGHSLGAMSLVAWAADHDVAARARAAALLNTGVEDLLAENVVIPSLVAGRIKETLGRVFMGAPGSLPRVSTPLSHTAIKYFAFGPEGSPAKVAFFERMLWECSPKVRGAVGLSISALDLGTALECLTVPTLVLAGNNDRLTPPSHARRIAERLPHPIGVVELPATGHMAPLERPRAVSRAILSTVREEVDAH